MDFSYYLGKTELRLSLISWSSTTVFALIAKWRFVAEQVIAPDSSSGVSRPLAIRTAYSHVPILGVILGVKIIHKRAQKRVQLTPKITRIVQRRVLYCVINQ